MRLYTIIRYTIVAALLPCCAKAQGQKVWKKTVSREVEIGSAAPVSGKKAAEVTLLDELLKEIRAGKLAAYANEPPYLHQQLAITHDNITPGSDTVDVVDELTGEKRIMVRFGRLFVVPIHTYRTLEEWTYDPEKGTTDIQITAIAPVRDVFNEDGSLKGVQAMFWVRYKDAIGTILKYEQAHPKQAVTRLVWKDNFGGKVMPSTFKTSALRRIGTMYQEDTAIHHLRPESEDTTWLERLANELTGGKMKAYPGDDHGFAAPYPQASLTEYGRPDTLTVIDEVSGEEKSMLRTWRAFSYRAVQEYSILEQWSFTPLTGATHIQATALAYTRDTHDLKDQRTGTEISLLVRYSDAYKVMKQYATPYYREDNLAMRVWDSYFVSEVKPEVVGK